MFKIQCTNDKVWNLFEFIKYLVDNQGKNIHLVVNPEAIDIEQLDIFNYINLFQFKDVIISTQNQLQSHSEYNIDSRYCDTFVPHSINVDKTIHTWTREKIFLCLYGRPTASRLGIAGWLNHYHKDDTIVHFSAIPDLDGIEKFEFDKLATYDLESVEYAVELAKTMPISACSSNQYFNYINVVFTYDWNDTSVFELYKKTLIDVVGETHVKGNTFFPTEKTFRSMLLKKPFITFASKNFLCYLRQMGFRTFAEFWNEDYDGFEGKDRYKKICNLIDQISKKSKDELEKMYWDMAYTLDHNYNLLQDQLYSSKISEI